MTEKQHQIHLILTEAGLEFVPKKWRKKKSVQKKIRKYGNSASLLDTAFHHHLMKKLPESKKRGRPDILHHFLLDALGSPLNFQGLLAIYFSAPSGLYKVSSGMRCPRNYRRFKGLMAQLLKLGHIPPNPPFFIEKVSPTLNAWMKNRFSDDNTIKFTSKGKNTVFKELVDIMFPESMISRDWAVMIGGFQKGSFSNSIKQIPGQKISISSRGFDSWIITQRFLSLAEMSLGII